METIRRQSDVAKMPEGRHRAATGLYLEVRGNSRTWLWIYEKDRQRHVKGLGSAKLLTLVQARDKVLRLRAKLSAGEPLEEEQVRAAPTLGEVLAQAMEQRKTSAMWRDSTLEKWMYVSKHIPEHLKTRRIDEVGRSDLLAVLKPLWKESPKKGEAARMMLSLAFSYGIHEGWIEGNPAAWKGCLEFELPRPAKVKPVEHHKAMSLAMVCRLMPLFAVRALTYKAVVFGALTATRASEFTLARWSEIDTNSGVWEIPPERRKDGKPEPFIVPLSKQAVKLLESLDRSSEWVFASHGSHLYRGSPASLLRRAHGVTMHGMRTVFRSWCADNGVSYEVAETCLMHSVGSAVSRSYQRSNLLAARREVMQRWADTILPM